MALFQVDPLRWTLLAWKPMFPLAVASLLFLHCHRVLWLENSWDLATQLNSLALSTLLLGALLVRAVGHAEGYRVVVGAVHSAAHAYPVEGPATAAVTRTRARLAGCALLVVGPSLALGVLGFLPGLMVVAFMVPVAGMVALEGRSLADALLLRLQLPPGVLLRCVGAEVVLMLVLILCWLNLVAGAQLVVVVLRMMSGIDVGVLAIWLSPLNVDFLISMVGLAFLLTEPLRLIVRALLYLDARLSLSGRDLVERWGELESAAKGRAEASRLAKGASFGALALGALALGSVPVTLEAAPPAHLDWPSSSVGPLSSQDLIESLEAKAAAVDVRVAAFHEHSSVNLRSLRLILLDGAVVPVRLGTGTLMYLDFELLSKELPEIAHRPEQAEELRILAVRLRESAEFVRQRRGVQYKRMAESTADPAELLKAELLEGGYDLPDSGGRGRGYREGLRARLLRWWEQWITSVEPASVAADDELQLPQISTVVYLLLSLVFGLLLLAVVLRKLRSGLSSTAAPQTAAAPRSPSWPLRSPSDLREQALELAARELFEEAARVLFLATLVELDREREIDLRPELCNGEHLRAFIGSAERRVLFVGLVRRFESHCYGTRPCSRDEFEQMLGVAVSLAGRTQQGGAVGPRTERSVR